MKHQWLIWFTLAVSCGAIGYSLAKANAKEMPTCYEDELAIRYEVPGQWYCINYEDVPR